MVHQAFGESGRSFKHMPLPPATCGSKDVLVPIVREEQPFGGVPTAFPTGLPLPMIPLDVVGMAYFEFH